MRNYKMIDNFAVMMVTCDAYDNVAKHFLPLLKLRWKDFDEKIYFVSEEKASNYGYEKGVLVNPGLNKSWSYRLEYALNQISEKYVLFTLDDYYLGKETSTAYFKYLINFMEENDLYYINMKNKPSAKKKYNKDLGYIKNDKKYGISLQASIWRKDYFLSLIQGKNVSAWEIENIFNSQVQKKFNGYLEHCAVDLNNPLRIRNGVIKGKWDKSVIKFFKRKNGYIIDPGNRKYLKFREKMRMVLANNIMYMMPAGLQRFCKKILKKLGFKFVTD